MGQIAFMTVLQILWANSHGIFIIGPFLVGCYLVEALLQGARGRGYAEARVLGLLTVILTFACMITPYGWNSIRFALLLVAAFNPDFPQIFGPIVEMQSPFSAENRTNISFWFYLLLVIAYVCSFAALIADQFKKMSIARTLVGFAMLAVSFTANRNMPLFAIVATPLTAEYLAVNGNLLYRRVCVGIIVSVLAAAGLIWSPLPALKNLSYVTHRFGTGLSGDYVPLGLPSFLNRIGFVGPVFNSQSLGGYYAFHGHPRRIPFYDGRFDAYQAADLLKVRAVVGSGTITIKQWRDFSEMHDFKGVLLEHGSAEAIELLPLLPRDRFWRLVYLDNAASFWIRDNYPLLPPEISVEQAADLALRVDFFQARELDQFFEKTGMFTDQRLLLLEQTTKNRDDLYSLQLLATLQMKNGSYEKADQTLKRLLILNPSSRTNLISLAQIAVMHDDVDSAEKYILMALNHYPDDQNLKENLAVIGGRRVNNLHR